MTNPLAVIGVGFLLGVRPATDPDQVVAVTTIVSRQQSIGQVGLVGALWGVGHTITIFLVGVAIILFNLAIPARIGLAMELAVGLMLILLGVLNLTGVTQWVTHRFTPVHNHAEAGIVHSHVNEHEGGFHVSFFGRASYCRASGHAQHLGDRLFCSHASSELIDLQLSLAKIESGPNLCGMLLIQPMDAPYAETVHRPDRLQFVFPPGITAGNSGFATIT